METYFFDAVAAINRQYGVDIDPLITAQLYGDEVLEQMCDQADDVLENIHSLLTRGFAENTGDICNRFGILLLLDPGEFCEKVDHLIAAIGPDYVDVLGEDMSHWETLM